MPALVAPLRQVIIDQSVCTLCGACESYCPRHAIRVTETAYVDPQICVGCGACVRVCPNGAIRLADV